MARYVTRVRTARPAAEVFTYLADLRNFAEWDPGVRRVEQRQGEGGGTDTSFAVTVAGIGRDLTLLYRTVSYQPPGLVEVEATSKLLRSRDRITVEARTGDTGCTVTYDADLRFNGWARLADPLLGLSLNRIGDRAAAGLRRVLDGEVVT